MQKCHRERPKRVTTVTPGGRKREWAEKLFHPEFAPCSIATSALGMVVRNALEILFVREAKLKKIAKKQYIFISAKNITKFRESHTCNLTVLASPLSGRRVKPLLP